MNQNLNDAVTLVMRSEVKQGYQKLAGYLSFKSEERVLYTQLIRQALDEYLDKAKEQYPEAFGDEK